MGMGYDSGKVFGSVVLQENDAERFSRERCFWSISLFEPSENVLHGNLCEGQDCYRLTHMPAVNKSAVSNAATGM